MIEEFLDREQKLYQALKALGTTNSGPLSALVRSWSLAVAVLGQKESDELHQDLFTTLEQDGDVRQLVRTWVK